MTERRRTRDEHTEDEESQEELAPSPEEEPIDEAVWESFPASDVPSTSSPTTRMGAPAPPEEDAASEDDERDEDS